MKKMLKKALKGFTLVELIVVIAIIAILSTVGFVSYTGYIRDSRNSVRQSDLAEAMNVITQFNAVNSTFPECYALAPAVAPLTCDFCKNGDTDCAGGIKAEDWAKMNVRKSPTDAKKKTGDKLQYYSYSHGITDFFVAATEEKSDGTFTAIVKGSAEGKAENMVGKQYDAGAGTWGGCVAPTADVVNGTVCVPYNWQ